MFTTIQSDTLSRSQVINALAKIRQDWESAVDGESLVDIQGSIGLLLIDLAVGLKLRKSEQLSVLGSALHAELQGLEAAVSGHNE